jgi:hypothetical protein
MSINWLEWRMVFRTRRLQIIKRRDAYLYSSVWLVLVHYEYLVNDNELRRQPIRDIRMRVYFLL